MNWITIYASVGKLGKNNAADVKMITALLNVYARQSGEKELTISAKSSTALEEAITHFQSCHLALVKPDGRVDSNGGTFKGLKQCLKDSFSAKPILAPTVGKVTWDSEGGEGGRYHSRRLHVPSTSSGLTLGRGYDFRRKTVKKATEDLTAAGCKKIDLLKKAVGLFGTTAKQFIVDNDLLDYEISSDEQVKLFNISYKDEEAAVKRICTKKDVEKLYGECDWDKLDSTIKQVAVDLKFRGDYTGSTRKFVQKPIADNDFDAFKKVLVDESNWSKVPKDRFRRRKEFINKASSETSTVVTKDGAK